jgi:subtilisin family serine protease
LKKRMNTLILTLTLCSCTSIFAAWSNQWTSCEYLPGRMIVSFNESIGNRVPVDLGKGVVEVGIPELDELFEEFEVVSAFRLVPDAILNRLKMPPAVYRSYIIEFRPEYPVLDVVDRFHANRYVNNAEPDLLARTKRVPNDPRWGSQWDKRLLGADFVWDVSTGDSSIICAGIDTGVDYAHPDLRPILWINPGEDSDGDNDTGIWMDYPGDTDDLDGVDGDENGYEDDLLGWDFIRNIAHCAVGEDCDNFPDNDMFGVNSHGTHVGGIMAADGDNGIGMSGFVWDGTLMALRAGYEDEEGQGYLPQSATLPAIYYAVGMGASIINMSYGGPGSSPEAATAMTAAWNNGAILFAASGNDGSTSSDNYPANYEEVIAVNATSSEDQLVWFSNRGPWTDLCAPGANVLGTVIGSGYQSWDGTSMASPTAAGVAALVWSLFPDMTNVELRELLETSAEDISSLNSGIPANHLGHGRVSASNAVAARYPLLVIEEMFVNDGQGGDGDGRLESGETAGLTFNIRNTIGWAAGEDISVTVSIDDDRLSLSNETFTLGNISPGQVVNNFTTPALIEATNSAFSAFWTTITLHYESPNGFARTDSTQLRVGRGQILLVDDDGGAEYQSHYVSALEGMSYDPDYWQPYLDGTVIASEMSQYSAVVWICGDEETGTLNYDERSALGTFLGGGGNLIMVGQGLDEDISDTPFYADYLHAQSDNGQSGYQVVNGVEGNAISDGFNLLLMGGNCGGNGTVGPSRILPVNGSEAIFTYSTGGIGAVSYAGAYKVTYFAFALEAACGLNSSNRYEEVLESVLDWMEVTDSPTAKPAEIPSTIALRGNFPNPFNPTTTIRFDLSSPAQVRLNVFDLLGREVSVLVNAPMTAGTHDVRFDGTGLASGVYVIRLQADSEVQTSKMMLLK